MHDVVKPCVLPKGGDVMQRVTSSYRVCCPNAVMSCDAQRCRPCVLSKGGDIMPRVTSSDGACSPRAVMSCHARRRPTVRAVQWKRCHPTPDVVRSCVLSKGGDVMPRPTSSDCVCCPKAVMSCHAQHCHRESFPQAVMLCYARRYRPCVLSKGGDIMPRLTSSNRACSPRAVISCHA